MCVFSRMLYSNNNNHHSVCVVVIVIDRNALELCFIVVCSLFTPSFAFTLQKQSSIDIYVYDAYTDTHIYREVRMWKDMRM